MFELVDVRLDGRDDRTTKRLLKLLGVHAVFVDGLLRGLGPVDGADHPSVRSHCSNLQPVVNSINEEFQKYFSVDGNRLPV